MSHDLFTDVVSPTVRVRSSSRYTLFVSVVVHALVVAAVVIVPLMASGVLPQVSGDPINEYVMPVDLPPRPPAPQPPQPVRVAELVNPNAAPIKSPDGITDEVPRPPANPSDATIGGIELGPASSNAFGSGPNLGTAVAIPDPPAPPQPQKPVRPGGLIREPVKTRHVPPVYPQIAIAARVSGTVVIDAVIGTDGTVREARVLSGSPLLNHAALEAVRQWRYTPTTLNHVPVPVIMTVTVRFNLN
jgi:periplasmic protein TonB